MDKETLIAELDSLLDQGNYLSVCLRLKEADLDQDAKHDVTGRVVSRLVDELAQTKNRERVTYFRSLLVWVFKDIPGLSHVYREQLRLSAGGGRGDLLSGLRTLSDLANMGRTGQEQREDFAESVRERVDDAADRFGTGEAQDQVNEFLSQAGQNVEEGLKRAADFFESLNRGPRGTNAQDTERPPRDERSGGEGDSERESE